MSFEKIKHHLLTVDKPARYIGGEFNSAKPKKNAPCKFLMCFPDVYDVALSNLGIKILYHLLNEGKNITCEFAFAPWFDMEKLMREHEVELYSLETKTPAKEFDMLGFSLQYELSYTNILYMLDLANIPLRASERNEEFPLIIGGGPCSVNPQPIADFFDLFVIGDGEDVLPKVCEEYTKLKANGTYNKREFLQKISTFEGVFVPSLNQEKIKKAQVKDLDKTYFPTKMIVPNLEVVHNRATLEIFRGCAKGCRFCQAGFIYRPMRMRKVDTLIDLAKRSMSDIGYDEMSLSSLSTCDYPYLRELLQKLKPIAEEKKVSIALPSTRVDSFESEFIDGARKSSLTFAVEAATQRLRDVIRKNITEEDILSSCKKAFESGYSGVKLYFMIGLPTETEEDIKEIITLAKKIKWYYKQYAKNKKPLRLVVSSSVFVPKPFTPFQWEKQLPLDEVIKTQNFLKNELRRLGIKYSYHDAKSSQLEAILCRGGRELSYVIEDAYRNGCCFDSWTDKFQYDKWVEALNKYELGPNELTKEQKGTLAWHNIDVGVPHELLEKEREKARNF
ncbi:MAG: TIGR03960 family B12-binding radical SAM protein [Firmicutes bacterium]|nr:TIGR03960 family B12-binding radical SAM protein [Bacillota bacterium]